MFLKGNTLMLIKEYIRTVNYTENDPYLPKCDKESA